MPPEWIGCTVATTLDAATGGYEDSSRRVRIEESVRVALAARGATHESEPEPETVAGHASRTARAISRARMIRAVDRSRGSHKDRAARQNAYEIRIIDIIYLSPYEMIGDPERRSRFLSRMRAAEHTRRSESRERRRQKS